MTIAIKYSCFLCGLRHVQCDVPARGEEHVKLWMDGAVRRIAVDHAMRSPKCQAVSISEIMIPMPPGTVRVGDPTMN